MAGVQQEFDRLLVDSSEHGRIQITYDVSTESLEVSVQTIFVEEQICEEACTPTYESEDTGSILTEGWESRADELESLSAALNFLLPIPVLTTPQCWQIDVHERISLSSAEMLKTLDIGINLTDTIQDILKHFGISSSLNIPDWLKKCPAEIVLQFLKSQKLDIDGKIYPTGSRSEGLSLPTRIGIGKDMDVTSFDQSDLDLLFVFGFQIPQALTPFMQSLPQNYINFTDASYWEVEDTKPGYFRYSGPALYIASCITKFVSNMRQAFGEIHGPAIETDVPLRQTDLVMAFEHLKWPRQAEEWSTRQRPSGWPNSKLVHDITQAGCHVIPKSHPHSEPMVENEWRLSFSLVEKLLASSLSKVHRQSYLTIKTLYYQELKSSSIGGLASYHLKTLLLWRAEKILPSEWKSTQLSQHVIGMLQQLYEHLQQGFMPNYFIPSSNLIDHIKTEEIEHLLVKIPAILADPLKYILGYWEKNTFAVGPFTTSWEEIKALFEAVATPKGKDELLDEAIKLSSWYIQDYPVAEKLAHDNLQFHVNFPDPEQNRELFHCFFQQQMMPLRAALFILQKAIGTSADTDLNSELSSKIFKLLTVIRDDNEGVSNLTGTQKYESIKQFFNQRLHAGLQEAAQNLHALLARMENQALQTYDHSASPSEKGRAAWSVLIRLTAHIFIIQNSDNKSKKRSQMESLSSLVTGLSEMKYPDCLYQCGKQLEIHALLKLEEIERVNEILEGFTAEGKSLVLLSKLRDEVIREKKLDEQAAMECRLGYIELFALYRSRFIQFKYRPLTDMTNADLLARWMEMVDVLDLNTNPKLTEYHPVGRMLMDRNQSPSIDNTTLYNFDKELSRCFSLPEKNMLRNAIHRSIESSAGNGMWHMTCRVAVAKYLIAVGKHTKACDLLLSITNNQDFCSAKYPLYPKMTETLLDFTMFSVREEKDIFFRAFCLVHVIMYAFYLLVFVCARMKRKQLAREGLRKMVEMSLKLQQQKLPDETWEVFANDLIMLSHAHRMCGDKPQALATLGQVALLETTSGLGLETCGDFYAPGKSLLGVFDDSLKALMEVNCDQELYSSLDRLMHVYYPDQTLYDALTSLLYYTNEGCDDHVETLIYTIIC